MLSNDPGHARHFTLGALPFQIKGTIEVFQKALHLAEAAEGLELRDDMIGAGLLIRENMDGSQGNRIRAVSLSHGHNVFVDVEAGAIRRA
jgi:hypothetical protein